MCSCNALDDVLREHYGPCCHRCGQFSAVLEHDGWGQGRVRVRVTTIDRDSGAIKAGKYSLARQQVTHFDALRRQLVSALSSQGKAGASFADLLGKAGVPSALSEA
jgi:hypothetical protein